MLVMMQTGSIFTLWPDCRQENQKLKELVTGGVSAAAPGSSSAPADAEAAEAKEEPVKEESPAVRPKMEVNTPQKVGRIIQKNPNKQCTTWCLFNLVIYIWFVQVSWLLFKMGFSFHFLKSK